MYNKVQLLGYLGKDPEGKYIEGGTFYVDLNVATNRHWKGVDGEAKTETEWHRVRLFNGQAEAAMQYLQKGRMVFCEGYLKTFRWQADGVNQRRTVVICEDIRYIPTSKSAPTAPTFETESLPADLGQQAHDTLAVESKIAPKKTGRQKQSAA